MHIKSRLISVASKKLILNVKMQIKVKSQNIYNANSNKKKAKVALIQPTEQISKQRIVPRYKSLFLRKRSVYQEDITIQIFMQLVIEIYEAKVERTARKYR